MAARKKKPQPIKALEGRWLAGKNGRHYAYIIETSERDWRNVQLYKLQSLMHDWTLPSGETKRLKPSDKLWSEADLKDAGRILKNAPTSAMIRKAKREIST